MPALVAGIHVLTAALLSKDVDGRDKPGHDDALQMRLTSLLAIFV